MAIAAGTLTGIAYLIAEALSAGVTISQILKEAEATGIVPPERWAKIIADQEQAMADWKAARQS